MCVSLTPSKGSILTRIKNYIGKYGYNFYDRNSIGTRNLTFDCLFLKLIYDIKRTSPRYVPEQRYYGHSIETDASQVDKLLQYCTKVAVHHILYI